MYAGPTVIIFGREEKDLYQLLRGRYFCQDPRVAP